MAETADNVVYSNGLTDAQASTLAELMMDNEAGSWDELFSKLGGNENAQLYLTVNLGIDPEIVDTIMNMNPVERERTIGLKTFLNTPIENTNADGVRYDDVIHSGDKTIVDDVNSRWYGSDNYSLDVADLDGTVTGKLSLNREELLRVTRDNPTIAMGVANNYVNKQLSPVLSNNSGEWSLENGTISDGALDSIEDPVIRGIFRAYAKNDGVITKAEFDDAMKNVQEYTCSSLGYGPDGDSGNGLPDWVVNRAFAGRLSDFGLDFPDENSTPSWRDYANTFSGNSEHGAVDVAMRGVADDETFTVDKDVPDAHTYKVLLDYANENNIPVSETGSFTFDKKQMTSGLYRVWDDINSGNDFNSRVPSSMLAEAYLSDPVSDLSSPGTSHYVVKSSEVSDNYKIYHYDSVGEANNGFNGAGGLAGPGGVDYDPKSYSLSRRDVNPSDPSDGYLTFLHYDGVLTEESYNFFLLDDSKDKKLSVDYDFNDGEANMHGISGDLTSADYMDEGSESEYIACRPLDCPNVVSYHCYAKDMKNAHEIRDEAVHGLDESTVDRFSLLGISLWITDQEGFYTFGDKAMDISGYFMDNKNIPDKRLRFENMPKYIVDGRFCCSGCVNVSSMPVFSECEYLSPYMIKGFFNGTQTGNAIGAGKRVIERLEMARSLTQEDLERINSDEAYREQNKDFIYEDDSGYHILDEAHLSTEDKLYLDKYRAWEHTGSAYWTDNYGDKTGGSVDALGLFNMNQMFHLQSNKWLLGWAKAMSGVQNFIEADHGGDKGIAALSDGASYEGVFVDSDGKAYRGADIADLNSPMYEKKAADAEKKPGLFSGLGDLLGIDLSGIGGIVPHALGGLGDYFLIKTVSGSKIAGLVGAFALQLVGGNSNTATPLLSLLANVTKGTPFGDTLSNIVDGINGMSVEREEEPKALSTGEFFGEYATHLSEVSKSMYATKLCQGAMDESMYTIGHAMVKDGTLANIAHTPVDQLNSIQNTVAQGMSDFLAQVNMASYPGDDPLETKRRIKVAYFNEAIESLSMFQAGVVEGSRGRSDSSEIWAGSVKMERGMAEALYSTIYSEYQDSVTKHDLDPSYPLLYSPEEWAELCASTENLDGIPSFAEYQRGRESNPPVNVFADFDDYYVEKDLGHDVSEMKVPEIPAFGSESYLRAQKRLYDERFDNYLSICAGNIEGASASAISAEAWTETLKGVATYSFITPNDWEVLRNYQAEGILPAEVDLDQIGRLAIERGNYFGSDVFAMDQYILSSGDYLSKYEGEVDPVAIYLQQFEDSNFLVSMDHDVLSDEFNELIDLDNEYSCISEDSWRRILDIDKDLHLLNEDSWNYIMSKSFENLDLTEYSVAHDTYVSDYLSESGAYASLESDSSDSVDDVQTESVSDTVDEAVAPDVETMEDTVIEKVVGEVEASSDANALKENVVEMVESVSEVVNTVSHKIKRDGVAGMDDSDVGSVEDEVELDG